MDKSMSDIPGPRRMLRPELPKVNAAGALKAEVSNHFWIVGSDKVPSAIRLGYQVPAREPDKFGVPTTGVKGIPDSARKMAEVCYPPMRVFSSPPRLRNLLPFPIGHW